MSEVFKDDITPNPQQNPVMDEAETIRRLFELTEAKNNPWRGDYEKVITDCYNFKELRQWDSSDIQALIPYDVPALAVDRINRVLDVVDGIRENTGNKVKVIKRAMGDEAVAMILDKVRQYVYYNGDFDLARDEAFSGLKDVGMGMRKVGFDPSASGGEGEIWCEALNVEEVGWSYTRKKNFNDVKWYWEHHTMDWEDAVRLAPKKAAQIKSLKATLIKKWDEMKGGSTTGRLGNDYQATSNIGTEQTYSYPDSVHIWEIWVKRIVPYKKVRFFVQPPPLPPEGMGVTAVGEGGQITLNDQAPQGLLPPVQLPPTPQVKKVPIDYELAEGEDEIVTGVDTEWYQNIIATGGGKYNALLLTPIDGVLADMDFDPYVAMVSQFKKSGAPRGLIEICIPHQIRANIGWSQKVAFNNKAIKSPLVTKGTPYDAENAIQQSRLGALLHLPQGTEVVSINQIPNVNLQALEEIASAKEDMDFAAAASEPVLRGQAQSSSSGISIAKRQDAAVTSINKWVKAEKDSELVLARKVLKMIIKKFPPERMARIVGEDFFYKTLGYTMTPMGLAPTGIVDPITQEISPAIPLPLQLDSEHYDCIIQDEAISDFNKQQTFNAAAALQEMGFGMGADYMIMNAPLKNPEEALASHMKWRNDIIKQQEMVIQQLTQALGIKMNQPQNGGGKNQPRNAQRGRNQSQAGQRSMLGGASPNSPVG